MKRKNSRTNPKDPWRIRSSSFIRDLRIHNSGSRGASKADGPKTSEYAFFTRFKKDGHGTSCSYPRRKEETHMEKSKSRNFVGEISKMVKQGYKSLSDSRLIENVTPLSISSFPSPKPHRGPLENSGTKYQEEDVFSQKRRKLCQLVADTVVPEIDELCSKGYDLVSVLLSRLLPHNSENNCHRSPIFRQREIDSKSQLLAIPELDCQFRRVHHTPRKNLVESEQMQYLESDSSEDWLTGSRELVLSKWDILDSGFPTSSCAKKNNFWNRCEDSDSDIHSERLLSFCTESNTSLDFPVERREFLASSQIKDLDEAHNINELSFGREPNTLLLGWEFDNMKDERDLSITTLSRDLSMYNVSPTSWGDDVHQESLDSKHGIWLSPSYLVSKDCSKFTPMPYLCASSDDHSEHVHEDCRNLPSCSPSFCDLSKDGSIYNTCKSRRIFFSDHSFMTEAFIKKHCLGLGTLLSSGLDLDFKWKHFPVNDFSGERYASYCAPQSQKEALHLGLTEAQFESFPDSSRIADTINCFSKGIHDRSSFCFETSQSIETGWPLLLPLNDSNMTGYDGELLQDQSEGKYI